MIPGIDNREIQGYLFLGMCLTFLVFGASILFRAYREHGVHPSWRWLPGVWLLSLAWRDSNAVVGYMHPFGLDITPTSNYVTVALTVAFVMSVITGVVWAIRGLGD